MATKRFAVVLGFFLGLALVIHPTAFGASTNAQLQAVACGSPPSLIDADRAAASNVLADRLAAAAIFKPTRPTVASLEGIAKGSTPECRAAAVRALAVVLSAGGLGAGVDPSKINYAGGTSFELRVARAEAVLILVSSAVLGPGGGQLGNILNNLETIASGGQVTITVAVFDVATKKNVSTKVVLNGSVDGMRFATARGLPFSALDGFYGVQGTNALLFGITNICAELLKRATGGKTADLRAAAARAYADDISLGRGRTPEGKGFIRCVPNSQADLTNLANTGASTELKDAAARALAEVLKGSGEATLIALATDAKSSEQTRQAAGRALGILWAKQVKVSSSGIPGFTSEKFGVATLNLFAFALANQGTANAWLATAAGFALTQFYNLGQQISWCGSGSGLSTCIQVGS